MSDYLRTVLRDEAGSVDFRPPDIQAIRRTGDRRIRMRRSVTVLAAVAVIAVVGGSVALFGPAGDRAPVTNPVPTGIPIWASGSTIHVGPDTIEVGHPVRAIVRTSAGFVIASQSYSVCPGATTSLAACNVYAVTGSAVAPVGHLDTRRLASDPSGPLAGWVDLDATGAPVLRTYDQATGEFLPPHLMPGLLAGDVEYLAIDGRTGYVNTPWGLHSVDLDTGTEDLLHPAAAQPQIQLDSAAGGLLAFQTVSEPTVDDWSRASSIFVGPSIEDAKELLHFPETTGSRHTGPGSPVVLSPTGQWLGVTVTTIEIAPSGDVDAVVTSLSSEVRVYDTATGEPVTLDLPGSSPQLAAVTVWLDRTTLQVAVVRGVDLAEPNSGSMALYRCSAVSGACELGADLGPLDLGAANSEQPVMPDGTWSAAQVPVIVGDP